MDYSNIHLTPVTTLFRLLHFEVWKLFYLVSEHALKAKKELEHI